MTAPARKEDKPAKPDKADQAPSTTSEEGAATRKRPTTGSRRQAAIAKRAQEKSNKANATTHVKPKVGGNRLKNRSSNRGK